MFLLEKFIRWPKSLPKDMLELLKFSETVQTNLPTIEHIIVAKAMSG